jgi:hypothetical protein
MTGKQKTETNSWLVGLTKNFHALLLLVCALGVIVYEIFHFFIHKPLDTEVLLYFIINLLAILAFIAGLERFIEFRHLKTNLNNLADRVHVLGDDLRSSLSVHLVEGYEEIYADAARLCCKAETSIKVLLMGTAAPAPESFPHKVAEHLARNSFVTYEVVVAVHNPTDDFWTRIDTRQQLYKDRQVDTRVHLYIVRVSKPIGFDVAIVDDQHAHIGFPPIPGTGVTEVAISFENEPTVAARLASWFAHIPGKTPYSEARREYFDKKKSGQVAGS